MEESSAHTAARLLFVPFNPPPPLCRIHHATFFKPGERTHSCSQSQFVVAAAGAGPSEPSHGRWTALRRGERGLVTRTRSSSVSMISDQRRYSLVPIRRRRRRCTASADCACVREVRVGGICCVADSLLRLRRCRADLLQLPALPPVWFSCWLLHTTEGRNSKSQ